MEKGFNAGVIYIKIMFIKKITIKNFKCFENEEILFNEPNGKTGSGLNILVGENNSGKTTLFSIFAKLKPGSVIYSLEKREDKDIEIEICDKDDKKKIIKNKKGSSNIDTEEVGDSSLNHNNIDLIKDNKFWLGNAGTSKYDYNSYRNSSDFKRGPIDSHLSMGLVAILDKAEDKEKFDLLIKKIFPDFREWTTGADDPESGVYIKYKVSNSQYVKIDHSVGSGILSIFRIVYSLIEDKQDKIIMIDEPEAFLHPIAQQNLLKVLEEESKTRQIVFTTHSPYMFRGVSRNSKFISFKHDKKTGVTKTKTIDNFILPLGPTYGEINYFVYNLPTEEFHNELYGYLEYLYRIYKSKTGNFDNYLALKNPKEKVRRKEWRDNRKKCQKLPCSLHTYIRHYIHHPENTCKNKKYSSLDLKKSIKEMIALLKIFKKEFNIQ